MSENLSESQIDEIIEEIEYWEQKENFEDKYNLNLLIYGMLFAILLLSWLWLW